MFMDYLNKTKPQCSDKHVRSEVEVFMELICRELMLCSKSLFKDILKEENMK